MSSFRAPMNVVPRFGGVVPWATAPGTRTVGTVKAAGEKLPHGFPLAPPENRLTYRATSPGGASRRLSTETSFAGEVAPCLGLCGLRWGVGLCVLRCGVALGVTAGDDRAVVGNAEGEDEGLAVAIGVPMGLALPKPGSLATAL